MWDLRSPYTLSYVSVGPRSGHHSPSLSKWGPQTTIFYHSVSVGPQTTMSQATIALDLSNFLHEVTHEYGDHLIQVFRVCESVGIILSLLAFSRATENEAMAAILIF